MPNLLGQCSLRAIAFCGLFIASQANGQTTTTQGDAPSQTSEQKPEDAPSNKPAAPLPTDDYSNGETIIVTAQKRAERLSDVPVPVAALDASSLLASSKTSLQDYYTQAPGVNLTALGESSVPLLAIRGITPGGYVNPTVGVVVDDVPFGASLAIVTGILTVTPDLDPNDLDRIEILRGPQGTLYGASSMGGLLKYVTAKPSTDGVHGRFQAGVSSVRYGEMGYALRGSVNVPLSSDLAIHVGGAIRHDPGWVDNVQTGEDDVNATKLSTARLAGLWRPTGDLTIEASALYQRAKRPGSSDTHVLPGLDTFEQSMLRNTGWYDQSFQAYSLTGTLDLGARTTLTSISGYSKGRLQDQFDVPLAIYTNATLAHFGVAGAASYSDARFNRFSQELRLATDITDRISWIVGAFYNDEDYKYDADAPAIDPATGLTAGSLGQYHATGHYRELAGFTDVDFKFTDRFDVQIGGRASDLRVIYEQASVNSIPPQVNSAIPRTVTKDKVFTYLLTPRYRFSDNLMGYVRLASGYRPGGPNPFPTGVPPGASPQYDHDTVQSYDVGLKGNVLDRVLSFDASLFYIDWKDVQLAVRTLDATGVSRQYTANAGRARSQGAELSIVLKPLRGMTITGQATYTDATLRKAPSNAVFSSFIGARLPYSSKWSTNLSVRQDFPLSLELTGTLGGSWSYVGDRRGRLFAGCVGVVCTGLPQEVFPAYHQVDVDAGLKFGTWSANLYVNNLTDSRGLLRGGRDAILSQAYSRTYTQPRTIGVSVIKTF
jgi:outer membrane receptor protein involved in Fe transport